jgi:hypothetical protein
MTLQQASAPMSCAARCDPADRRLIESAARLQARGRALHGRHGIRGGEKRRPMSSRLLFRSLLMPVQRLAGFEPSYRACPESASSPRPAVISVRQWLQFDDGSTLRAAFDQTAAPRHSDRGAGAAARGWSTSLPFEARRRRCRSAIRAASTALGASGGAPASRSSAPTGPMRRARSLPAGQARQGRRGTHHRRARRRLGRGVAIAPDGENFG